MRLIERMENMKYPLLIAASFLLAAFLYGNVDIADEAYSEWDLHQYIKIAQAAPGLDPTIERPFAFRFLVHYAIGLLPIDVHVSYLVINYTFILILLIAMYRFLLSQKVSAIYAFFAVFFYLFNKHFIGYNMWNPYQINDVLMNLIIIWFLYSIYGRRRWGVAGALIIGSLIKETYLILLPTGLVFLLATDRKNREILNYCVVALVVLSISFMLRQLIPTSSGDTLKDAFSSYAIYKLHTIKGVYHYFFNPWLPFTIVPLIYYRETWHYFKDNIHYLVLLLSIYFSGFFGLNVERLVHPGFIVFYSLLIVIVMKYCGRKPQLLFFATFAFLSSLHYIIGRYPLPSRNVTIMLSGGAAIGVTIYVYWNKLRMSNSKVESYASH